MLGKLSIALGGVRNSKKGKEKECKAPQGRPISYIHTDASQALAPSTCCWSLAAGSCSFHSSFLIRLDKVICCLILSLLKYFQRALWDKRQKALWKQASFSPILPGTPVIPQGMYRCYTQYYNFFFQMITQMLAHALRKAHIKILFVFSFKVPKAAAKRQGVVVAG